MGSAPQTRAGAEQQIGIMSGCSTADGRTHVVLDVQVTASFEEDVNNLHVAFVGSQMQRTPAILQRKHQQISFTPSQEPEPQAAVFSETA